MKDEIEKQLRFVALVVRPSVAARKKLQTASRQNVAPQVPPFDPVPLMSIGPLEIDDEESIALISAYFNHLLRVVGAKQKYEADQV